MGQALKYAPVARSVQSKLGVGALDDPLERQADAAAAQIRSGAAAAVSVAPQHAATSGTPAGVLASVQEVRENLGQPLDADVRTFFEPRFGYDFSNVRVHADTAAARSASLLHARAWTAGDHIAFGQGLYAPRSRPGRELLAHELAHVIQQGAGLAGVVQRSALSDSVREAWTTESTLEALLARLSRPDVQNAQSDADVDAELAQLLVSRPDDLWVAQRVRAGRLGTTSGALGPKKAGQPVMRAIEAYFFRGLTDRRALVIAGVHGTERQGMEVARMLINDLQTQRPQFTVIVVPSLFPDNAAADVFGRRESVDPQTGVVTETNRNFPKPSEDLAAARAAGGGTAVDATTTKGRRRRAILPENVMLIELLERFHPERIISIHGTTLPGSAGVFYDQRKLQPAEIQAARQWAAGNAYMHVPPDQQETPDGQERLRALEEHFFDVRIAELSGRDRELSAVAAKKIDADTAALRGRGSRSMERERETPATLAANEAKRRAHPSVAGNVGASGKIDLFSWSGSTPGGTSLGGYAPPRGMSVFTVEPAINRASSDYPTKLDSIDAAERKIEQQAYADAVRTVLLGLP